MADSAIQTGDPFPIPDAWYVEFDKVTDVRQKEVISAFANFDVVVSDKTCPLLKKSEHAITMSNTAALIRKFLSLTKIGNTVFTTRARYKILNNIIPFVADPRNLDACPQQDVLTQLGNTIKTINENYRTDKQAAREQHMKRHTSAD